MFLCVLYVVSTANASKGITFASFHVDGFPVYEIIVSQFLHLERPSGARLFSNIHIVTRNVNALVYGRLFNDGMHGVAFHERMARLEEFVVDLFE